MIRLIKSMYEAAVARRENETTQLTADSRIMKEASEIVTDRPDKDGWVRLFQTNDREKGLLQSNQLEMVRKAREFYRFDPNARAALSTMLNYIMGRGLAITPKANDTMVWYVWREFWTAQRNKMDIKQFEIVLRSLRDGEIFIEFFDEGEGGKKTGKATVRFVDPLLVRAKAADQVADNNAQIQNGVVTDPEDAEKVLSYSVQSRIDQGVYRSIPAARMIHIKINVDSDQKRGETQLLPIMNMIRHYEQWLDNRIILNKMRSAIVLIKKVEGTALDVANLAKTLPTARNPSNQQKKMNFRGGSVITEGPGVTYRMESPNINAGDVKEDGRNIKLNMAAGTNLPEYVFGDASNANYSSSLIAESPFVKAVQFWQCFYQFYFAQIYRKVIEIAVEGGVLEAPNDDEFLSKLQAVRTMQEADAPPEPATAKGAPEPPDKDTPEMSAKEKAMAEIMPDGKMETPSDVFYGCDMQWPEIVHRDIKLHTDALTEARQNGWIADSTACAALGYDYAEEVRKQRTIEEEAEQLANPLLGKKPGDISDDGNMDSEMQDALNAMSPEDRNTVMNAKTPQEVMKAMAKANKATATASAASGNGNGEGD